MINKKECKAKGGEWIGNVCIEFNYTYQKMRGYVENKINRKLNDKEYNKLKREMKNYILKKLLDTKEWKAEDELNIKYYPKKV